MIKLKTIIYLVLTLLSVFILGMYTMSTLSNLKPVQLHQWLLTSFFGIYFLLKTIFGFRDQE